MDRCRCNEYADAVKKLRFYTVGTVRPDILENHDRSGVEVHWMKHGVDYVDMKFCKPKAFVMSKYKLDLSPDTLKYTRMWCPYMSKVKI